ncbi:MAG: polymerase subunit sigma-70, partial [Marmoricola sp.]|nr:polymerase subunit sigma-70 [Marmoricola sp.]
SARATLPVLVEGRPGSAWFHRGEARVVFDFAVVDGLVQAITFRADPTLLSHVVRRDAGDASSASHPDRADRQEDTTTGGTT